MLKIWGTKPSTVPTPPMMPSTRRLSSQSGASMASSRSDAASVTIPPKKSSFTQSVTGPPMREQEMK